MHIAGPEDLSLINRLIDRGLVDKRALLALLESQKSGFESLERRLQGTRVLIDPQAQELRIEDGASGEVRLSRPLPFSRQRPADWEAWGSRLALVNHIGGSVQSWSERDLDQVYGLVLSEEGPYLYDPRGLKADTIGYSLLALYGGICRGSAAAGPCDLHLSPDQAWLALSNRAEGSIELLETRGFTSRLKIKLRPDGGGTALNLAFDLARNRLVVTDQSSSMLALIDLASGELTQHKLGLGLLGNLIPAPDGEHLYLLTTKPNQELVYLRMQDFRIVKSLLLKGDLFSAQSSDPCDLMALSADGQHLLVMTYQHSPAPFTPLLSVIDTQQVKTVRRYALKDGYKPFQLAFARGNPLEAYRHRDVREIILSSGLVDPQAFEALAHGDDPGAPAEDSAPSLEAPAGMPAGEDYFMPPSYYPPVYPVAQAVPSPAAAPAEPPRPSSPADLAADLAAKSADAPSAPQAAKGDKADKFTAVDLDPEVTDILIELLREAFFQQTGIALADRPGMFEPLQQEAQRVRPLLQRQNAVPVELDKLADGRGLRTVLRRRQLLLRQELRKYLRHQDPAIVPLDCPQCRQKLMGSWECQVCGFEVENPLHAFATAVASGEPVAELTPGHFLLPDPEGLRLLELDSRKQIVWMLDPDQLSCDYPVDVLRMPRDKQERLLVADSRGHQIYEIGLKGKIHWYFETTLTPEHALKNPVRIGYYRPRLDGPLHYLIVDQGNHRVLEVDREHCIHWRFGVQGHAGEALDRLNSPTDLQYTPDRTFLICDAGNARVLEVDPVSGEVEQVFDAAGYGLTRPVLARRLWNGKTLIVDAGTFQLIELSPAGAVSARISYYKPGMPDEIKLTTPTGLARMPNQDVVLYNAVKALQLLPLQKKLVWVSSIRDLGPSGSEMVVAVAPPPVIEAPRRGTSSLARALEAKNREAKHREAKLEEKDAKPRQLTGEDRLKALINKRPPPSSSASNKESFEHAVLYQREDLKLAPLSLYLLDWRHNAVLRINRKGKLTWHYGFEMGQKLARPAFVQECTHSLLITDADNQRILEVAKADKEILRAYVGPPGHPFSNPRSAQRSANGNLLIADQRNRRLIELNSAGELIWEFRDEELLASPQYVEALPDGDVLVCDSLLNRVIQIDRQGQIQWYYGSPPPGSHFGKSDKLFGPSFATRLPDGRTLIADTRHHRVLEVTPLGEVVWEYIGHARSSRINPTWARRLENGNTLISFFNHTKVIELNPQNQCVWSYTMGKDVFQPPVEGDEDTLVRHETDKPTSFYNAVEKRMLQSAGQSGQAATELHIELMDNVQMKSTRAQVIMYEVEKYGMVFKSFPPPEDLLADRFGKHLIITCLLDGSLSSAALGGRVANIAEVLKVEVVEPKIG